MGVDSFVSFRSSLLHLYLYLDSARVSCKRRRVLYVLRFFYFVLLIFVRTPGFFLGFLVQLRASTNLGRVFHSQKKKLLKGFLPCRVLILPLILFLNE